LDSILSIIGLEKCTPLEEASLTFIFVVGRLPLQAIIYFQGSLLPKKHSIMDGMYVKLISLFSLGMCTLVEVRHLIHAKILLLRRRRLFLSYFQLLFMPRRRTLHLCYSKRTLVLFSIACSRLKMRAPYLVDSLPLCDLFPSLGRGRSNGVLFLSHKWCFSLAS